MNYDHNKNFGLFKFHSGYRKFYLNSPTGYSQKQLTRRLKLTISMCRHIIELRLILMILVNLSSLFTKHNSLLTNTHTIKILANHNINELKNV